MLLWQQSHWCARWLASILTCTITLSILNTEITDAKMSCKFGALPSLLTCLLSLGCLFHHRCMDWMVFLPWVQFFCRNQKRVRLLLENSFVTGHRCYYTLFHHGRQTSVYSERGRAFEKKSKWAIYTCITRWWSKPNQTGPKKYAWLWASEQSGWSRVPKIKVARTIPKFSWRCSFVFTCHKTFLVRFGFVWSYSNLYLYSWKRFTYAVNLMTWI